MENPCVNSTGIYFNLQNDQFNHRSQTARSTFPPTFKQTFNSLDYFAIHFDTLFLCILGFRSPVYPALARILHGHTAQSKRLNKGILILSDLELPALPYIAPFTAISRLPEYQLYYALKIVWQPCAKVICHSQKYTRDHQVMRGEAP